MSASNERLGDEARERVLREIIEEEEARLGPFELPEAPVYPESPTLQVERNWNEIRWGGHAAIHRTIEDETQAL